MLQITQTKSFTLIPFARTGDLETIGTEVVLQSNTLHLNFSLVPRYVPEHSPFTRNDGLRRDNLWTENCLELFVSGGASPAYWEYNFSLLGNWNCYRFNTYRNNMGQEDSVGEISFSCVPGIEKVNFHIQATLPDALEAPIRVCPAAVIIDNAASTPHYFAPCHLSNTPDFHLPQMRLPM